MKTILLILIFGSMMFAKEKSTLSYGLGVGFISAPEYIGSSKRKNMTLPFPYIEYKSDKINIDRNKVFNDYFKHDDYKIELSMTGLLPVTSKNSARQDMPDLDATIEFGPNFIYHVFKKDEKFLNLEVPVRTVFSVDSGTFDYQGYVANINLHYQEYLIKNIKLDITTGFVWGDESYHNFYYEVDQKYETVSREEYHSKSGYGGWQNSVGLTKKDDKFWYGAFVKYYNLTHVAYNQSPLVEKNSAFFYGFAVSYLF